MKLMNFIYKILGFESDDVKVTSRNKNTQKASYNLKVKNELPKEIDGVKVFYPTEFEECKDKVELLKNNTPFFLDFRAVGALERNKILDYFNGVIAVLNASIEEVEKNLYIFLPKNMEIDRS